MRCDEYILEQYLNLKQEIDGIRREEEIRRFEYQNSCKAVQKVFDGISQAFAPFINREELLKSLLDTPLELECDYDPETGHFEIKGWANIEVTHEKEIYSSGR